MILAHLRLVPTFPFHRSRRFGRLLRATALGLSAVLVAGCAERPDDRTVARVGEWNLDVQRLADLLVLAQPLPLDSATVGAIVEQWIAAAALAQRAAAGTDLDGEEAMGASLWLERREAVLEADRRQRLDAQTRVSAGRARSEFEADTLRLLAHVLRRTGPFTSAAERDLQRRTAQGILDGLLRGGSWADAVKQSEDEASRSNTGLLGLLRVNELPAALRDAATRLLPGQVSSVIESPDGYHILYRPRWTDVADLYGRLLSDRLLEEADARTTRRLEDSLHVQIAPGGLAAVRALALGNGAPAGQIALATWDGGALAAGIAARYVSALPDEDRAGLAASTDEAASRFLEELAVRQARLDIAQQLGVEADPETLAGLADMHHADVEAWKAALSEGGAPLSRQALDRYMERLVARQAPFQPVAPLFRQWLLEPLAWSRNRTAQDQAVAAAQRMLDAAGPGRKQDGDR